jgi:hypothetical protein
MTIELTREDDSTFHFLYFGIWQKVLELARMYGWQPEGTSEPPNWREQKAAREHEQQDFDPYEPREPDTSQEIWMGQYDLYLGELVNARDAAAMADALEHALDDLPDNDMPDRTIETEMEEIDQENQISISFYIIEPNKALNLFEVFGGQYKQELIDFIAFSRRGGFHIHSL